MKEALRSHQSLDANYEAFAEALHHRAINPDGECGPATQLVLDLPRCGHPDYSAADDIAEAVGSGNWKRCHGVGEYHSASIRVTNSPPSFLAPLFDEVKKRTVDAYAEVGLLLHFDGRNPRNIDFSFVGSSTGWIGLAIVSNNSTCSSSPIWCRYLSTYRGGSTNEAITTQWTTLVKHELGHNTGMGHTNGGVMNPSLINNLPTSWRGDVAWNQLAQRFGGQPVPREPEGDRELWLGYKNPDGSFDPVTRVHNSGGSWFPRN